MKIQTAISITILVAAAAFIAYHVDLDPKPRTDVDPRERQALEQREAIDDYFSAQ